MKTKNNREEKAPVDNNAVEKNDLKRMRDKAAEYTARGQDIGVIMADALIRGMRDIGYKNTATALFELIDNSIQAGAQKILVELRTEQGDAVNQIAVVDNAHGMPPEWLRFAIRWGGTHRERDRDGFGRYGYGMKSASISFGRKLEVFSKPEDVEGWSSTCLDLDEIARGGMRDATGNLAAPEVRAVALPKWIEEKGKETFGTYSHGTAVVISSIDSDRLTYPKAKRLKELLLRQIGVTYRNFLRQVDVMVNGTKVMAIDPLFTTPDALYFDEDDDRAAALDPLIIDVKAGVMKDTVGQLRVRYSYMPPTFLRIPDDKDKVDGRGAKQNERFRIRKENNGIIVLRAGRQIDVVDPKTWTKMQNDDRYIGIEVDFTPVLDEEFHITTSKQQAVISDRIWDILEQNGVREAITSLRNRFRKDQKKHEKEVEDEVVVGSNKPRPSEQAMIEAERYAQPVSEAVAISQAKEGDKRLDEESEKVERATGIPAAEIKEKLTFETQGRPYKLVYEDVAGAPFYRMEQVGGQKRLYINTAHAFYTELYASKHTSAYTRYGIETFLYVLGVHELSSNPEMRRFYHTERGRWSETLSNALAHLSSWDGSEDASQVEQEMPTSVG